MQNFQDIETRRSLGAVPSMPTNISQGVEQPIKQENQNRPVKSEDPTGEAI